MVKQRFFNLIGRDLFAALLDEPAERECVSVGKQATIEN